MFPETDQMLKYMRSRKIIHIDMDAFYASVEQRDNPEFRGKPVAVGHSGERGVVAAASYEARRFGIRSAMPSVRAKALCPDLIFIEGRMSVYKQISQSIHEIFRRYTDVIEPLSLDEAFLDVTVNKQNIKLGVEIARRIKSEIHSELGLVASAGVSYCKFLAKIASDYRKPNGLCTIHPDKAREFISKLRIEDFWGVGPVTAKKMHSLGVHSGFDLRLMPLDILVKEFGKVGYVYHEFANGLDLREVETEHIRKSIGTEHTFQSDTSDPAEIKQRLNLVVDELMRRIERHPFLGTTLTLKVRFADFIDNSRSVTQVIPFADRDNIINAAGYLMTQIEKRIVPIRLIGLTLSRPYQEKPDITRQFTLPFPDDPVDDPVDGSGD